MNVRHRAHPFRWSILRHGPDRWASSRPEQLDFVRWSRLTFG